MKKLYVFFGVLVLMFFISNKVNAQIKSWAVPEYAKGLKNPFSGNVSATNDGKKIYEQMCVLCHGHKGEGNGEAGLSLEPKPANFLAIINISKATDGEIFWKITTGKPPMSSYDELLTEDQRWKLVNYIRQLSKK